MLAQAFDVGEEVVGGVGGQVGVGPARVASAAAAATLFEEHDAVGRGIEESSPVRSTSRARSTVQNYSRLAVGVAALFPVEEVAVADVEPALVVWLGRRMELSHGGGPFVIGPRTPVLPQRSPLGKPHVV